MRGGRKAGCDLWEARDEGFAVGLVHAVLHGVVDEPWVGRGTGEGGGEDGETLEVEYLAYMRVMFTIGWNTNL